MHQVSLFGRTMNFAVSGYVYFVALMLVFYMVTTLATTVFGVAIDLMDITKGWSKFNLSEEISLLESELLHTIAFTIVLVKAYKILAAFAETQHINIKFLVEIAIIAPTIELIFNNSAYKLEVNILFAAFAFANLLAYLFFYKTLKTVNSDYVRENK